MNSGTIRGTRSSLIFLADLVVIFSTFSVVFYYRIGVLPDFNSSDIWLIAATFTTVLFLSGSYFRERSTKLPRLPVRTIWLCILAGIICIGWLYVLGPSKFNQYFGRGVLPAATILCGLATTLIRFLINRVYHLQEQGQEILYLGYSASAENFIAELQNHSEVRSVTFVSTANNISDAPRVNISTQTLEETLAENSWQLVIVDPSFSASARDTERLVEIRLRGTPVVTVTDFFEEFWYMIPVAGIDNNWFLRSHGFSVLDNPTSRRIKRVLDVLLALVLLTVSVPVLIICALLILLTSRGSILYKQQRVGFEGKPFTIFKLRTMVSDAEADGAQWASANDSRTTPVGGFLRASRLDEIPQCWNVILGEMSFVGPRPERPEFTKALSEKIPYYDLRHLVKPGITGWAQVVFPYGASVDDSKKKLQYELFYIKNQSLILDLNIMLRTIITVFQRAGR